MHCVLGSDIADTGVHPAVIDAAGGDVQRHVQG